MKALGSVKKADMALVLVIDMVASLLWWRTSYCEGKQALVAEIIRYGQESY